jgi:outer membrane protein insertion porin family
MASSLALLAGGVALATPAIAQAVAGQESGVVVRIVVQGNERVDQQTVLSYLPIQPGDTVDPARIDLAIKALFRTDLFSDVRISLQGSDLIVKVIENPIINKVVFEGNHSLTEDKLREEVNTHPRGIFTKSRVQQDVQRIVELYRRAGRISATVSPKIVELPQKRVDLIFEISEGPKTGVARVNFLGNKAFSDSELRDQVVTKETALQRFFSSNTNYDPDRLEYDREQIRKYYTNHGYYDFHVVSAVAELVPDQKNFKITMTVDEGEKYTFGKLSVETANKKLDPEFLRALLPIHTGQLYQSDRIEDSVDALTYAAGSAGYAFVDIRPRYKANKEKHTVDVTFEVREGPHVYIERIDIVGNTQTVDPVIRRELLLTEGDAYNKVLLDRSKNNVRRLGYFKDVQVKQEPGSAADKTVVVLNVEEQPTGELSFGAGFSSIDKLLLDVGVTQKNFRGQGEDLRARISVGAIQRRIDLSFTEPRFGNRDLRAGVDLYSYLYNLGSQASFETETTGGGLRLGFPLNNYTYLSTRYTLTSSNIVVADSLCTTGSAYTTLCDQRGSYLTSSLGYTLNIDRRNDPQNPTRGWKASLRQDLAGFGGDVHYLKTEADFSDYYAIKRHWVFLLHGEAGYIDGWDGDSIRIGDRFFKGGYSFRGFQVAGIGPRDVQETVPAAAGTNCGSGVTVCTQTLGTNDALGGNLYAIGTVELAFPNGLPEEYGIKTAWFTDFGTLGMLDYRYKQLQPGSTVNTIHDDLGLRASAGLSVRWKSPMGPIQFDLSQILAKQDYDRVEHFRFSTYTPF